MSISNANSPPPQKNRTGSPALSDRLLQRRSFPSVKANELKIRTVVGTLTEDTTLQVEFTKELADHGLSDRECEAVQLLYEQELEGCRREGLEVVPDLQRRTFKAAVDQVWAISTSGPHSEAVLASREPPRSAAASSRLGIHREGSTLRMEATALGGGRASLMVSRGDPPGRLLLDTALLASERVRQKLVERLPEDTRAEAGPLLEDLAAQVLSKNGSATPGHTLQGSVVEVVDVEPWPEPVSGDELLGDIVKSIKRYIVQPEEAAVAEALWSLHTHALDAADISPILCFSSPVLRCGKSRTQTILQHLVRRPVPAMNITAASVFRLIERHLPTLLLDEWDSYTPEKKDELRNLLNCGVTRDDAYVYRTVGDDHEVRRFSVFGPKSVSLIGKLPPTLEDRAVVVRLERRKRSEPVERLRRRRAKETFGSLQRMAARWAADHLEELSELEPEVPLELNDRAADFWEPLLAIADVVSGVWPDRARRAAVMLSGDEAAADDTPSIQLLADLRDLLTDEKRVINGRIASRVVPEELAKLEDRPWAAWGRGKPITASQISRLLKRFDGAGPKTLRIDGQPTKGYDLTACQDAFDRYLPALKRADERGEDP